ncbi:MAG: hypothetical protein R3268_04925, partial [Acidiferrobacterales bacterium]|nr:hypothetical protein [Acidiferrobacterales bacterium]
MPPDSGNSHPQSRLPLNDLHMVPNVAFANPDRTHVLWDFVRSQAIVYPSCIGLVLIAFLVVIIIVVRTIFRVTCRRI